MTSQITSKSELNTYSVLMSVYAADSPEYLEAAVRSMLNQSVIPDDFILVEDGPVSKELDSVAERMRKIGHEKNVDFEIVRLSRNCGLGIALDEGIKHCRNNMIARMDADDIAMPDRCEKELKCFMEYPDLDIVSGAIAEFEKDPDNIRAIRYVPLDQESIVKQMHIRSPFNHPAVMYKKSSVLVAGGYGNSARKEDHDLFSRMLFGEKARAMNIPDVILKYRVGQNNIKRRKSLKNISSYFEIMKINRKRGYVSWKDCLIVYLSQVVYFILPERMLDFLIRKLLRKAI